MTALDATQIETTPTRTQENSFNASTKENRRNDKHATSQRNGKTHEKENNKLKKRCERSILVVEWICPNVESLANDARIFVRQTAKNHSEKQNERIIINGRITTNFHYYDHLKIFASNLCDCT